MESVIFCDRPRAQTLPALELPMEEAARRLGAALPLDAQTAALLQAVTPALQQAAMPRMAWASLPVAALDDTGLLQGTDILRHLNGCTHGVLLAVTLGPQADAAIRRAGVGNVARLAAADAAASALAEAAADAAEAALRAEFAARGLHLTGRYSPGYGDWPLAVQQKFCSLLDTPRLLGVSVSDADLLLPRKSITALLGVSNTPVSGYRAGCAACALRHTCEFRKRGNTCADP